MQKLGEWYQYINNPTDMDHESECEGASHDIKIETENNEHEIVWQNIGGTKTTKDKALKLKFNESNKIKIKNVEDTEYKDLDELDETQKQHKMKSTMIAHMTSSAINSGAVVGISGVISAAPATEVLSLSAFVGTVFGIGIGAGAFVLDAGYTKYKNIQEGFKSNKKKAFNGKLIVYQNKLEQLNAVKTKLESLKYDLIEQEQTLNKYDFFAERLIWKNKVIIMIGPTGYGKSLVCNRLIGDTKYIDDIEKKAIFPVATNGTTKSITKEFKKISKIVSKKGKHGFRYILSVIDTPGAFDSDGNDKHFDNIMKQYFNACGGVNMFYIFYKLGSKLNNNYKILLKKYERFWNKNFWKHCCVIITNCDKESKRGAKRMEVGLRRAKIQIRAEIGKLSKGLCNDVEIYPFGIENFKDSTNDILTSLSKNNIKYKCDTIISPMDITIDKAKALHKKYKTLVKNLKHLKVEMDVLKTSIGDEEYKKSSNKKDL